MRARYPDTEGFIERDGVKVAYEVYGSGEPALVFAPTDPIVNSQAWKAQVPYLARFFRVVTIDPRGNGRSDRPPSPAAYADTEYAADTIAVMDAAGIDRAVLVGMCSSSWWVFLAAGLHPDRVLGVVSISSWVPFLTPPLPWRVELRLQRGPRHRRGLGQRYPPVLAARLAGIRRVLLRRATGRAALHQAARGLRGLGHADQRRDEPAVPGRAAVVLRPRGDRGRAGPGALPGAGHPRQHRTAASRGHVVNESPNSPAVNCCSWRAPGTCRSPGSPSSSTAPSGTSPAASVLRAPGRGVARPADLDPADEPA